MKLTIYRDRRAKWRWRMTAGTRTVVAECGEAYGTRQGSLDSAERMLCAFNAGWKIVRKDSYNTVMDVLPCQGAWVAASGYDEADLKEALA